MSGDWADMLGTGQRGGEREAWWKERMARAARAEGLHRPLRLRARARGARTAAGEIASPRRGAPRRRRFAALPVPHAETALPMHAFAAQLGNGKHTPLCALTDTFG
jgi:hypothetical protein